MEPCAGCELRVVFETVDEESLAEAAQFLSLGIEQKNHSLLHEARIRLEDILIAVRATGLRMRQAAWDKEHGNG